MGCNMIKIEYERYNNKDFIGLIFAKTEDEKNDYIIKLKKLSHVTKIKIGNNIVYKRGIK